jgi:serine/threonine protein kinase
MQSDERQDPLIGQTVAEHYRITDRLGAGGMGSLYKASNQQLDQAVALKFVNRRLRNDVKTLQRLRREAQILGNLSHPNIIAVKSFHVMESSEAFLVLEYLEGETLTQFVNRQGALSAEQFHKIFEQVCAGLAYAHSKGIIHRDLKPDNIMLMHGSSDEPQVKLLDFGLAKFTDGSGQKLTATGTLVGSLNYISPEQCAGGKLDQRADVYSLACVMYNTLTGQEPFDAPSNMLIIRRHMEEPLPALPPEHSPALSSILQRCTAVVPDERLSTVDEMWRAIQTNAPVAVAIPAKKKKPIPMPVIVSIAAAGLVLVVAAAYMFMTNLQEQWNKHAVHQHTVDAENAESARYQSLWEEAKLGVTSGATPRTYEAFFRLKGHNAITPAQAHELGDLIYANYSRGQQDLLEFLIDAYVDCRIIECRAAQAIGRPDVAVQILKKAFKELHDLKADYTVTHVTSKELLASHMSERQFFKCGLLTLAADQAEFKHDDETEFDRREESWNTAKRMFELLADGEHTDIPDLKPGQTQPPESLVSLSSATRDKLAEYWIRHKKTDRAAAVYKEWLDLMSKYHCGQPGEIKTVQVARAALLPKNR